MGRFVPRKHTRMLGRVEHPIRAPSSEMYAGGIVLRTSPSPSTARATGSLSEPGGTALVASSSALPPPPDL